MSTTRRPNPDRATVLRVAADLECDPRTAAKLIAEGPDAARNIALRERAVTYFANRDSTPPQSTPPRAA